MNKAILTDGNRKRLLYRSSKAINPWDPDDSPEAWVGAGASKSDMVELVPAVQSAVHARCKGVSDVPFTIYNKSGNPVDDSDDYQNKTGLISKPRNVLWLTEAALSTSGQCYWFRRQNPSGYTRDLQYFLPGSIQPKLDINGLQGFERKNAGRMEQYTPEQILYFWLPDQSVEIGPPHIFPLQSALLSAKSLHKINEFIANYMERGAVKAMLLSAKSMPTQEEAERVENWFNKFMRGVDNLRWKIFNADAIQPTIVGEGLEAFNGVTVMTDLTAQVHTAMGTRHMLEDENYATAEIRQKEFYSNTIIPEAKFIQDVLNDQLFVPLGYRFEFEPERMELFSDDNLNNMQAFGQLAGALNSTKPQVIELALSLLGLSLTDEQEAILDGIKQTNAENKQKLDENMSQGKDTTPADEAVTEEDKTAEDMAKWMRKAGKHIGKDVTFMSIRIPQDEQDRIHAGLIDCKCADDLKKLFYPEITETQAPTYAQPDFTPLIEAMRLEVQAIKATTGAQNV